MDNKNQFLKKIRNPFYFSMFSLSSLPMVWLAGIKIKEVDATKAIVTIRYKYLVKNPFKSIYFACLAMTAELSTGILAMANIYQSKPGVSMLVTSVRADFLKKAVGLISFECVDGLGFEKAVELAKSTNEGQVFEALSIGRNADGVEVARFYITWSFKSKKGD